MINHDRAPRRHQGVATQEALRRHPGGTQEASPGLLASRVSWRHQVKKVDGRLQQNAKVLLKCQFYFVFLRVGVTKYGK